MVLQHPGQHFTGSQLRALQQGLEAAQEHELLGDLLQAMALIEEAVAAFVRWPLREARERCVQALILEAVGVSWLPSQPRSGTDAPNVRHTEGGSLPLIRS